MASFINSGVRIYMLKKNTAVLRLVKFSKGHSKNCLQLKESFHTKLRHPFTRQSPKMISGSKSVSEGTSFHWGSMGFSCLLQVAIAGLYEIVSIEAFCTVC